MIKRLFDVTVSAAGLLACAPLFAIVAVAIKLGSRGPVLFQQQRVGRDYRTFRICKFRTMVVDAASRGPITWGGSNDPRITSIGRILRRTKVDELPQLINVLKGEMSFVGPRPEVPEYVELFNDQYREILTVRPGITDFASIEFRDEGALLARSSAPREVYIREIMPEKIRLSRQYLERASFLLDLTIIVRTLVGILWSRSSRDTLNPAVHS